MKVLISLWASILSLIFCTNAFAYNTLVAFATDVSNTYPTLNAKVVVHCGLGKKQKNTQTVNTSAVTGLGPSNCAGLYKRETTDLYINELPLLADWFANDGSDNFCITDFKPGQLVAGYRADKSYENPCDAPDPVTRRTPIPNLLQDPNLLVKTFAPKIFLHPDERFQPMHAENYIEKASLRLDKQNIIVPEGELDIQALVEQGSAKHIVHHPDKVGDLDTAICYAFPRFAADQS